MQTLSRAQLLALIVASSLLVLFLFHPTALVGQGTATSLLRSGLPVRLKIPAIAVDAAIEQVGLTSTGAMDVPKGPDGVGWFSPGTHPGQVGSAVIAGHRGWKSGIAAVFDNLSTLRKGDTLSVVDDQGKSSSFVVREIRTYDKDAIVPEVFASPEGTHLNLITCTGDWDASKHSSTERLVIFTDLVQ